MPTTLTAVSIAFTPVAVTGADRENLIAFLTGEQWPFHVRQRPTRGQIESSLSDGAYDGTANRSLWVDADGLRVGLAVVQDLTEDTAMFDLRLTASARGRGFGAPALQALTARVFSTAAAVRRFEGVTREDNVAMRRLFLRAGFVKEAHYREGWPVAGGQPLASIGYAVLRSDWESGRTTPLKWDDLTS